MSEVNQAARSLLRPSNFRKLLIWLKVPLRHADDVSQNGFVRFHKKLPTIALSAEVLPLLKRFVVFEALNFRRLASGRREVLNPFDALDLDALGLGDGRQGPEDHAIAREHCKKVLGWIEQLDDRLKAVLVAHVRDGMSLADIAKAQGITEKAAEHRLASARSALQALMERWQAEPRRSGKRVARLLPLLLWEFDERTWFKERLGVVARTLGSGAQGALLGGLLIVGHAADRSPSRHALHHLPVHGIRRGGERRAANGAGRDPRWKREVREHPGNALAQFRGEGDAGDGRQRGP